LRRLVPLAAVLFASAAVYALSPLASAWFIREAIRTGDAAYLEQKIEWSSVKATLRESLAKYAFKPPEPATEGTAPKRGLWQRMKTYLGRRVVDGMVESYATPTGLPQLFNYGRTYRSVVDGEANEAATLGLPERIRRFWSRVQRAEFRTPTEFEIEIADKHDPRRHYTGLLRLAGFTWKLVALYVSAPDNVGIVTHAPEGLEAAGGPR